MPLRDRPHWAKDALKIDLSHSYNMSTVKVPRSAKVSPRGAPPSYASPFRAKQQSSSGQESRDCGEALTEVNAKYFTETSIHGLKYLGEARRHPVERLFWFLTIACAWGMAGWLIYKVLEKWQKAPVLVSFDSTQVAIYDIPFPSLTICNMNKVLKSRVENIENELDKDPTNTVYQVEREFVDEICAKHETLSFVNGSDAEGGDGTHGTVDDGHENLNLTGELLHKYLADLSSPCDEMLLRCHFEGHYYACADIFKATITDEGQCCSFNIMPEPVMFNNAAIEIDEAEEVRWSNWSMQNGYVNAPDLSSFHSTREMPLRAIAPGLHMGLSVVLDVKDEEYFCSGTESVGFKALLHTPISLPEMIEYGFAVSPGTESFIAVSPSVIHADEAIHKISTDKRKCYLEGEKSLEYFKHYSFLNCFQECASNYTFAQCHCVAYYMPRNPDLMPICAPAMSACVDSAVTHVEESAYDTQHIFNTECQCLPSCSDMEFPHETSVSRVSKPELINLPQATRDAHPEYNESEYVSNNLAILHVYFKHLHFMQHQRGELFGPVDFVSNIGGLLGLCMGFSVLSAVEAIYFFTMRLFLNIRMPRRES